VPVISLPVRFAAVSGGGSIAAGDATTLRLGIAGATLNTGPALGPQIFSGTAGGLTLQFPGYIRPFPGIAAGGVVNAASQTAGQGLAPGSYISIYGTALADALLKESTSSLPVSLAGVGVIFEGAGLLLPGHLHFVSPGQVNVQIPWEFQGQPSVNVRVTISYLVSATYTVRLATYSPGIFVAGGNAAVLDQNYALVTSSNPARRGQVIQIYANGLGPVSSSQVSGDPASTTQLVYTNATPTVTIGGASASVGFSGLAPGNVGLYQINVTVPSNAPTGNQPLVISMNGVASAPANLPVQ
jgi:minor extracellular serine protease Vpr